MKKKIVIDTTKEMIIAGSDIVIEPVTISRKNFTLRIKKTLLDDKQWADDAQNAGVDIGDDVKVGNEAEININNALINTKKPPTVSDLVRALKTMKIEIGEIIETIKLLDSLGAINADVEIVN